MTIVVSKRFTKEYRKLPTNIQVKVKSALRQLPNAWEAKAAAGLKIKKMVNYSNIYEARVDLHYRLTFTVEQQTMTVRRIGTHEIYRKP